jgi:eukaryotic-like serine/threonine-protein kinase
MSLTISTLLRSGELLDHYRLGDLVARGGTASVFRATDTKTGCSVAIKIPLSNLASDRLRYEVEISRRLNHPGIVKVLPGAGDCYVVMEWIEGQSLRQILDDKRMLPVGRAIRITMALCDVLHYLHTRGVLHRDLKPENVIVDAADNVKVIDFGTAGPSKMAFWTQARPAETMGTPDYVSPEQMKGRPADARTDIYSLGIMLFEMLAGEVPFSGLDTDTALNLRALIDPPALSELTPGISARLEDVIHRAIARDPSHRYASAVEFASELSDFLAEETAELPFESLARS